MSFRALHRKGDPLLVPNAWDAGSAKILKGLGFNALASTSAGAAFAAGRSEGTLSPDEMIDDALRLTQASGLPVTADLENCGPGHDDITATLTRAAKMGLAGGSIEDHTGDPSEPIYPFDEALARVNTAVTAAGTQPDDFVLTARAEGRLHGHPDLNAIIERLQAFAEAGADVVYAPGLTTLAEVARVCDAVPVPVNVLVGANNDAFTVATLAEAGAARISLGSSLARQALGGMIRFATALRDDGQFAYGDLAGFDEIEALLKP